jgi:hypothetical protein
MPGVRVKLHDWPVEKNIAAVRDGRLQLAILVPPLKANALEELRFQELATLRVCLAVSSDHSASASDHANDDADGSAFAIPADVH